MEMIVINFVFTLRLQQYRGDDGNQFYIYIQITTIPRSRRKSIFYLHLDHNITTEMMVINFIIIFRIKQYYGDDGNQFGIYV